MTDPRVAHVIRIKNDHSGGGNPLADGTPPDQVASDDSVWMDVLRLDKVQLLNPKPNGMLPESQPCSERDLAHTVTKEHH